MTVCFLCTKPIQGESATLGYPSIAGCPHDRAHIECIRSVSSRTLQEMVAQYRREQTGESDSNLLLRLSTKPYVFSLQCRLCGLSHILQPVLEELELQHRPEGFSCSQLSGKEFEVISCSPPPQNQTLKEI